MMIASGRMASVFVLASTLCACQTAQDGTKPQAALTAGNKHVTFENKSYHCGEITERGVASIYTRRENGTRTSSGIPFNDHAFTTAHKTLPHGTVTNIQADNGRDATVKVTDRGPFVKGRIVDVPPVVARALSFDGLTRVGISICTPAG